MAIKDLMATGLKLAAFCLGLGLSGCAMTPLMKAAAKGDKAAVDDLIRRGADVNKTMSIATQSIDYPTALVAAAAQDHTDIVRLLLANGAKADLTHDGAPTALMCAAYCGHAGTAKALIDAGADVNLHASVSYIWNAGCKAEAAAWHGPGSRNGNPLGLAVRNGRADVVKVLLAAGADTGGIYRWYDGQSGTLTDMAVRNGHEDVARILETDAEKFKALARVNAARAAAKAALEEKLPDIEALERAGDEAARAGEKPEALENYIAALRETPAGTAKDYQLRGKAIRLALTLQEPPSVPEEGRLHAERAKAFLKRASGPEDYSRVAGEFREASLAAPWWADIYYNLGLVLEKSGDPEAAEEYLGLYLLAAPRAPDSEAVRRKIVELQVARELEQN